MASKSKTKSPEDIRNCHSQSCLQPYIRRSLTRPLQIHWTLGQFRYAITGSVRFQLPAHLQYHVTKNPPENLSQWALYFPCTIITNFTHRIANPKRHNHLRPLRESTTTPCRNRQRRSLQLMAQVPSTSPLRYPSHGNRVPDHELGY